MSEHPAQENTITKTETVTVEAHGPGGFWGKISGSHIEDLLFIIIVLICFAFIYNTIDNNKKDVLVLTNTNTAMFLKQHEITQGLQKEIIKNQHDIIKLMAVGQERLERAAIIQTYVNSLDERGKKSLNLLMPDELKYNAAPRPR